MYKYILLSFLLSVISMPLLIKFCKHESLYDYQNARKIHSGNIPRIGGLGIAFAFFISSFLYLRYNSFTDLYHNFPVLIASFLIFIFAFADDLLNFHAVLKLLVQVLACFLVMFNNLRFTRIFNWHLPENLSYIITFCWILGLINAFNLIDGLDGLCGTLALLISITMGIISAYFKNPEAGLFFILAASILGFLLFNKPPAKIFMGDCGSQFLGFMVAILPLYNVNGENVEYNKFLILIIITAFPVFDTIAAIWRRIRDKKPIMVGDRAHLHHKLLNLGYSGPKVLCLITWIQSMLCGVIIISLFLNGKKGCAMLMEAGFLMVLFFAIVHFENRKVVAAKENKAKSKTESK